MISNSIIVLLLQVVDLLLAMASAACKSHRRDIIFEPFPTVVDPQNPCELALHPKVDTLRGVQV